MVLVPVMLMLRRKDATGEELTPNVSNICFNWIEAQMKPNHEIIHLVISEKPYLGFTKIVIVMVLVVFILVCDAPSNALWVLPFSKAHF